MRKFTPMKTRIEATAAVFVTVNIPHFPANFIFLFLISLPGFSAENSHNSPRAVERISHESLCLSAGCRLMTLTVKKHWHFAVCLFAVLVKLDCPEARSLARLLSPLTLTSSYSSSSSFFSFSSFLFLLLPSMSAAVSFLYRGRTLCHG